MTKRNALVILLFSVLLLTGLAPLPGQTQPVKPWTFMVYLSGPAQTDLELENYLTDLGGTASDNANILLMTNYPVKVGNVAYKGMFSIAKNTSGQSKIQVVNAVESVNLAGPNALSAFLGAARQNYPANHYALVLASERQVYTDLAGDVFSAVFRDKQTGANIRLSGTGLAEALSTWVDQAGHPLDVLFIDAPYQQNWETAFALRDDVDYLVAPQSAAPTAWFRLGTLLRTSPWQTLQPQQLAEQIVQFAGGFNYPSMSALKLQDFHAFGTGLNALAMKLMYYRSQYGPSGLQTVRNGLFQYNAGTGGQMVDLRQFLGVFATGNYPVTIRDQAAALLQLADGIVVENVTQDRVSSGFSAYYPAVPTAYLASYDQQRSSQLTAWDSFVKGKAGLEVGDRLRMTTTSGASVSLSEDFPVGLDMTVTSVNAAADEAVLGGTLLMPGQPSATLQNMGVRVSTLMDSGMVQFTRFPVITGGPSSVTIGGLTLSNIELTWDAAGIHLDGDLVINNLILAGSTLTCHAQMNVHLDDSGLPVFDNLNLTDINATYGDFTLQGNGQLLQSPWRIAFTGSARLGAYGTLDVTDFVFGLNGQVHQYGTIAWAGGPYPIGSATLDNLQARWDGNGLFLAGSLSMSGVPFLGSTLSLAADAEATLQIQGGHPTLTAMQVTGASLSAGDCTLTGDLVFQSPDRFVINGTLSAGANGSFAVSNLVLGLNGQFISFGQVTYSQPQWTVGGLTLTNVTVALTPNALTGRGAFQVSNVAFMGSTFTLNGEADVKLAIAAGRVSVSSITASNLNFSGNGIVFTGSVAYDGPSKVFTLNGNANIPPYGTFSVSGFKVGLTGQVVAFGTWQWTTGQLVMNGVTVLNPVVTLTAGGLNVTGQVRVDGVALMGSNFTFTGDVAAQIAFRNGAASVTSFTVSNAAGSAGTARFTGSLAYDGALKQFTLNGTLNLPTVGNFTVSSLVVSAGGQVVNFGTWTWAGGTITLGGLTITNPVVVLTATDMKVSGAFAVNGAVIMGTAFSVTGDATATVLFQNGQPVLSSLAVSNVKAQAGNLVLTGSVAYAAGTPGKFTFNGVLNAGSVGTFSVKGLVVGTNGQVFSYGTLTYTNPQIVIGGLTLSNVSVSWNQQDLDVSGGLTIGNVPVAGRMLNVSCTAAASFRIVNGAFTLSELAVTNVSASAGGLQITGDAILAHAPDRLVINGQAVLGTYATASVQGLEIGLGGQVYSYGTLTVTVPQVIINNFTLKNLTAVWSAQTLTLSGNVSLSNIPVAGQALNLSVTATAVLTFSGSTPALSSFSVDDFSATYGNFTLSGSAQYLSNPSRFVLNGVLTAGTYGTFSVQNFQIGANGAVISYGTLTYTNPVINLGSKAQLQNVTVQWDGAAISLGGTLAISGVQINGAACSFGATAQAKLKLANGTCQLDSLALTGLSMAYNDFSITASANYLKSPDRIQLAGNATLGVYGKLAFEGMEIGLNGTVYSWGTFNYSLSNLKVGNFTLSNFTATWSATGISASGTVGYSGTDFGISASGLLKLSSKTGALKVDDFQLTGVSGQYRGFGFSGSAVWNAADRTFTISGSLQLASSFTAAISNMVVNTQGQVLSFQSASVSLTIGSYGFSGALSFPAKDEIKIAGSVTLPAFLTGSAGGSIHLRKHPGGGVLNCGWDVLAGSMSLPSFKVGTYTFGGGSFAFDQVHITGQGSLNIPNVAGIGFSFDFGWNGQFNSACLTATGMRIPLGTTGIFLNGAGGCLKRYTSPTTYWEIMLTGTISDATGMIEARGVLTIGTNGYVSGLATLEVADYPFASASLTFDYPKKQIDAAAWLGENPSDGIGAFGISLKGQTQVHFNWGGKWAYGTANLSLELIWIDFAGIAGAFGVNYPYYPITYGSASCQKLRSNGVAASGSFLWWVYGAQVIRTSSGWDVDLFSCSK
ncbi:MAG: hypothetical protein KA419_08075 [Acidobacteria bacterium]|nr:hypothetical protein [Acidobacteriota bacterium]